MNAFTIVDEDRSLASIDVLETATGNLQALLDLGYELVDAARLDPEFVEGALHQSVAPFNSRWSGWGGFPCDVVS